MAAVMYLILRQCAILVSKQFEISIFIRSGVYIQCTIYRELN